MSENISFENIKKVEVNITGIGGEFGYGLLDESEDIETIKDAVENDSVSLYGSIAIYDLPIHVYGPSTEGTCDVDIRGDDKYLGGERLDDLPIKQFTYSSPQCPREKVKKASEDALFFGGYSIEDGILYSIEIDVPKGETFDMKNLYIGVTDLDDVLTPDRVISQALYLSEKAQKVLVEFFELEDIEELEEELVEQDFLYEFDKNEELAKILEDSICQVTLSGEGEHKYSYAIVRDKNYDELFDGYVEEE